MPPAATRQQRLATQQEIETRLAFLGVTRAITEVGQLLDTLAQFVEDGIPVSGIIRIVETGHRIEYNFQNRPDSCDPRKSNSLVTIKK